MASPADDLDCFMHFTFRLNECKNKIIVNAGNIFTIITLNSYIHKLIPYNPCNYPLLNSCMQVWPRYNKCVPIVIKRVDMQGQRDALPIIIKLSYK